MALEIAGSRVLAPHFGNSVFVWGSLISVVLTSSPALGSYVRRSSCRLHYPSRFLLNLDLPGWFRFPCSPSLRFPIRSASNSFRAACPTKADPSSARLSCSSFPVSAWDWSRRLQSGWRPLPSRRSSAVSERLYAISTVEHHSGFRAPLVMTFILIPQLAPAGHLVQSGNRDVGNRSADPSLRRLDRNRKLPGAAGRCDGRAALCLRGPISYDSSAEEKRIVQEADTPYHHITVDRSASDSTACFRVRSVCRNRDQDNAPPYDTLATYTNYFHLAFVAHPQIKRTLFIGTRREASVRGCSIAKIPRWKSTSSTLMPRCFADRADHFHHGSGRRRSHPIAQGRPDVSSSSFQAKYDCIILDAFTIGGRIPFHSGDEGILLALP